MPAIFQESGSSATVPPLGPSSRSLTKRLSAPHLSGSFANPKQHRSSLAPGSLSKRIRSKTERKVQHEDENKTDAETIVPSLSRTSILRRLSPGLAARVKLLDGSAKIAPQPSQRRNSVGRIPEDHIRGLDGLHQDLSIKVEKRGQTWIRSRIKREKSLPNLLGTRATQEVEEGGRLLGQPVAHLRDSDVPPISESINAAGENLDLNSAMATVEPVLAPRVSSAGPNGVHSNQRPTDLEEYLKLTADGDERPPPPPPKDTPPTTATSLTNAQSYFNPLGLHRAESIFSFSRASFSNQLSQLTSINLPQPSSLEASINSISTAQAAVKALIGAADQIQKWIKKASEVLSGLDAEDDVEWAAAGGREGLDDVDKAVMKFENLVNIYVKAIEDVQIRGDIENVAADDLKTIVTQMEATLKNWGEVRSQLKGVKEQVELAMEWEELWSVVLGDVGLEIDNLSRLIFQMEEKRHKLNTDLDAEPSSGLDVNELETIMEDSPVHGITTSNKRFSVGPVFSASIPPDASAVQNPQDDSNLMQLFARMQPLRASLDFLPMRLIMFQSRAERIFPSACEELEDRRKRLEKSYKKLETDAEALRKELGEDRWILVFRSAGRQAQKMSESVERSIAKLQESLEAGDHHNNQAALTKKTENYEAKKTHYIPAVERVISIIQKGIKDRLTVNGEIVSLLADIRTKVDALKASMKVMDSVLEEANISKSQQLRDSVSSIITVDSPATGSTADTPGSSPASSVIIMSGNGIRGASTPNIGTSSRRDSSVGSTAARSALNIRRYSGLPQAVGNTVGKSSIPRASTSDSLASPTSSKGSLSITPTQASCLSRPSPSTQPHRPRWNGSSNTNDLDVGHNFKPLSVTTPSPYKKSSFQSRIARSISNSSLPVPSPLGRTTSTSPVPSMRSPSRVVSQLASPTTDRTVSPTPSGLTLEPPLYSKLRKPSAPGLSIGPRSRQSYAGTPAVKAVQDTEIDAETNGRPGTDGRPGTALGHSNRRVSMIPQPKIRSGPENSSGSRKKPDERPPWR
ncbi:hypothetical protein V8E54_005402 [Elaphomyces granulatus]